MTVFVLILNYQVITFHKANRQVKKHMVVVHFNLRNSEIQMLLGFKHLLKVIMAKSQQRWQKVTHGVWLELFELWKQMTSVDSRYLGFSTFFLAISFPTWKMAIVAQCSYHRPDKALYLKRINNSLLIRNKMSMLTHKYAHFYSHCLAGKKTMERPYNNLPVIKGDQQKTQGGTLCIALLSEYPLIGEKVVVLNWKRVVLA